MTPNPPTGPLVGLRVVEFQGIGPGPHCAMLLSDLGAEVLRIGREGGNGWPNPIADRGRATLTLDIRTDAGRERSRSIVEKADVLLEGFRPGVMERLGLGPDQMLDLNPRLIYGRITGWGQDGPLAKAAGHDINYIAITGALAAIGRPGEPATPPLNLVGDFGGGSMLLAFGVMAALWERERSGRGQVVDAAIVDGVASLMTMFTGLAPSGHLSVERGANLLGGAAPFYRCYFTADGLEVSVGALERPFYAELLRRIGAPAEMLDRQLDRTAWAADCAILARIFQSRTRAAWCELLEGTDCCFAPVLDIHEASAHPQMIARRTIVEADGLAQASPAPRFSRTPGAISPPSDAASMLAAWGVDPDP
jgi:alpha-methylacyl-CoA racemase